MKKTLIAFALMTAISTVGHTQHGHPFPGLSTTTVGVATSAYPILSIPFISTSLVNACAIAASIDSEKYSSTSDFFLCIAAIPYTLAGLTALDISYRAAAIEAAQQDLLDVVAGNEASEIAKALVEHQQKKMAEEQAQQVSKQEAAIQVYNSLETLKN